MTDLSAELAPGRLRLQVADHQPNAAPGLPAGVSAEHLREERLHASAVRFEAAFLAEILRHSGLGKMPSAFNGGAGESAFTGSLIQEYATKIAKSGGVGLADSIFNALIESGAA